MVSIQNASQVQEYLISKARESLNEQDSYLAKSFFLTASCLFPNSFKIQFERYNLAKQEENIAESCKIFTEIIDLPDKDELMLKEIETIVEEISYAGAFTSTSQQTNKSQQALTSSSALLPKQQQHQTSSNTQASSSFYRQLFHSLPKQLQYKILLSVAGRSKASPVRYCKLMMLIMKRFPEKINEHAFSLVDMIIRGETFETPTAEQQQAEQTNEPNDFFSKLLIFDVFPLILGVESNLVLQQDQVQQLLENLFKFFVQQSSISRVGNDETLDVHGLLLHSIDEVQAKLREIFDLIHNKMQWQSLIDLNKLECWQVQYHKLSEFYNAHSYAGSSAMQTNGPIDLRCKSTATKTMDPKVLKQVFFTSFMLFLIYLDQYIRLTVSQLIVVEYHDTPPLSAFLIGKDKQQQQPQSSGTKKRKMDLDSSRSIGGTQIVCNNPELQVAFSGANKFFEFLNQDLHLQQELFRLIEIIGFTKYKSYATFIIDSHIYRGDNENLVTYFHNNPMKSLKSSVQLVGASIAKQDHNLTISNCVRLVQLIAKMESLESANNGSTDGSPDESSNDEQRLQKLQQECRQFIAGESDQHQLCFVSCKRESVLAYAIEVLIYCLRNSIEQISRPSELGIGHLVVLSQFAWPRYAELFMFCLQIIRENYNGQRFSYPGLLDYLFNSDMLEEFMALLNSDHGPIDLRILGQANQVGKTKTMTTRGINKNAKEEVRNALTAQMRLSRAALPCNLFIQFICNELQDFNCSKLREIPYKKAAKK